MAFREQYRFVNNSIGGLGLHLKMFHLAAAVTVQEQPYLINKTLGLLLWTFCSTLIHKGLDLGLIKGHGNSNINKPALNRIGHCLHESIMSLHYLSMDIQLAKTRQSATK